MKALLQKELRENLWLAVLGLIVFVALLGSEYITFREAMSRFVRGAIGNIFYNQPLRGPAVVYTVFFCAIFGAVLGGLQVFREQQRNVWGFLLHRPMTPTGIFLGKVLAGLGLYLAVAGLPLLMFLLWASQPGNVPAPFDEWMLFPFVGGFVNGVPFYFAGLLAGVRRAKWYGSRILPLGLPFLVTCCGIGAPQFWQILVLWLPALGVVALAAWASFCNSGYDSGQHPVGKPATAIAVAGGWGIALFFAVIMLADVVERLQPGDSWIYHNITRDGSIYKIMYEGNDPVRILDLEGAPAHKAGTTEPLRLADLDERRAGTVGMQQAMERLDSHRRHWIERGWLRFSYWGSDGGRVWYFLHPERRLAGYDVASRRFIGSIGPSGFMAGVTRGGDHFTLLDSQTLGTDTALYRIDLSRMAPVKIFSASADDPIVSVGEVRGSGQNWRYSLVATRRAVALVTPEGETRWRAESPSGLAGEWDRAFALEPEGSFLLWDDGSDGPGSPSTQPSVSTVAWVRDGKVTKTASIETPRTRKQIQIQEKLLAVTMPPIVVALSPTYLGQGWRLIPLWSRLLAASFVTALICIPIGWVVGRRRGLSTRACLAWSAGLLVLGIPGLLALLSIEEPRAPEEPAPVRDSAAIFEQVPV